MNAADLARLELARRAYRATEPSSAEVQAAVRRARLGLRRPPLRRSFFSKAVVVMVLAIGGLAFAKPRALGELFASLTPAPAPRAPGHHAGSHAAPAERPEARAVAPAPPTVVQPAASGPLQQAATAPAAPAKPGSFAAAQKALASTAAAPAPAPVAPAPSSGASQGDFALGAPADSASEWGRVGQALARGDESRALEVLGDLSQSPDKSTRDKADLGRAQLMLATGDRDGACALARSLTHRRAGGHIERQALTLLKSCPK